MPKQPTDQFKGAEQDISQQRKAALTAVAMHGRRGLEEGVIAARGLRSRVEATNEANIAIANEFNVPTAMRARGGPLAEGIESVFEPFVADAQLAQRQFRDETNAAAQVNSRYYQQAAEAVPQLRSQAQQAVEQYRQAYEERQAEIRAEAEQRAEAARQAAAQLALREREMALNAQMAHAQMAADRQIAQANLAAMQASRPVVPPPAPAPAPAARSWGSAMASRSRRGWGR